MSSISIQPFLFRSNKNLFKISVLHCLGIALIMIVEGCQWKDPVLKILKTCTSPTEIVATKSSSSASSYIYRLNTETNELTSLNWKVLSGTTVLTQGRGDGGVFGYTFTSAGTYTIVAEIQTQCGDKITLSTNTVITVKTCVLPTAITNSTTNSNTYTYSLVNGVAADVKAVLWKVFSGSNVVFQEQRTEAGTFSYTFSSSGSYTISAEIETVCGEKITRTLGVTVSVGGVSATANFKAWRNGSSANDVGNSVAVDGLGNVYVIGNYGASISFGATTLSVAGANDVFIAKYNSNGDMAWVQRITGDGTDEGKGIAVDANGDIYVVGQVSTNAGFFNTTANVISNSPVRRQTNGPTDVFVAKYNRDGQMLWNKLYGGGSPDQGVGIAVHTSGIYITGFFSAPSATFGSTTIQASGGEGKYDAFLAKLNGNGDAIWAVSCGGFENDYASSVAVDTEGNAYMTGNFSSPATFRSASGASTVYSSNATPDIFLAKYSSSGNLVAFHNSNSGTPAFGSSVAVSGSAVYVTGTIQGANYGNTQVNYRGGGDIFLAKYNLTNLSVEWVKTAGGAGADAGNGVVVDKSGNVYITGLISNTSTFDNTSVSSSGNTDVFLAQYDSNSTFKFVKTAGGGGADGGTSLAVNTAGNLLLLSGFYSSSFVFGTAPALSYSGGLDIFVAKYPD